MYLSSVVLILSHYQWHELTHILTPVSPISYNTDVTDPPSQECDLAVVVCQLEDIFLVCDDFNCPTVESVIDMENIETYLVFNCFIFPYSDP